jgi:hypothetical protein
VPSHRVWMQGVTSRAEERYREVWDFAQDVLTSGTLGPPDSLEVYLNDEVLLAATKAYFLVSDAYKAERLENGHTTEPPKLAAISALVFADFKPLRIIDVSQPIRNPLTIHANALLSLYWAGQVFNQPLMSQISQRLTADWRPRYYRVLKSVQLASLSAYKLDISRGIVAPYYDMLLDQDGDNHASRLSDMPLIESMVLLFELLWQRPANAGK